MALQTEVLRRLHLVVFLCYFFADISASVILFHLAPLSAVCLVFPDSLVYSVQHLIATTGVILGISLVWWAIGSPAAWEQLRRSREPVRVMAWSGVGGLAIDLAASLLIRLYSSGDTPAFAAPHNFLDWIAARLLIWVGAYTVAAALMVFLLQPDKRRPALDPLPKFPR
jgi:hypothetical protein